MFRGKTTSIGVAMVLGLVGAPMLGAPAAAQTARGSYAISAGPLGGALNQFGRAAGIAISYDPASVGSKATAGVKGQHGAAEALAILLRGTGLAARPDGAGGFTIGPAPVSSATRPAQRATVRRVSGRPDTEAQAGEASDIVVTASRSGTELDALPVSVSLVNQATLTRQLRQNRNVLSSLEAAVPGLSIQNSDDRTGCGSRIRGRQASIQINGVPVNEDLRQGSCSGPFTVAPFAIERVEVVRGGSALYGAGAPGGIINLVTRRAKGDALEVDLTAQTSFNTRRAAGTFTTDLYAGAGQKLGSFDYYLGAGYTDGGRQRDADGNPVPSQAYHAIDLIGSFGLALPAASELRLTATFHDEDAGRRFYPDGMTYPGTTIGRAVEVAPHPQNDQARDRNFTAALSYAHPDLLAHKVDVSLFYQNQSIRQRDNFYSAGFGDFFSASDRGNSRFGLRSTLVRSYAVGAGSLKTSYGFDYTRNSFYRFTVNPISGAILSHISPEVVLRTYSAFGQVELNVGALSLSGGLRQEWYRGEITSKGYRPGLGGAATPGAIGKSDLTLFNLGAIYRLTDGVQLYAGFSQGAALSQLGRAARNVTNPRILTPRPATSDQYEAGIRGRIATISFGAAGYYSRSSLGAELTSDPTCAGQAFCPLIPLRAPQRFHGFEANVDWDATPQLALGAVLTWQRGKIYDDGLKRFIDYSSDVAVPLRITGRANWTPIAPLSLGLQATHYDAASNYSPVEQGLGFFPTQPVTIVAGSARYAFGPAEVYVTADNLFNNSYLTPLSQANGPGSFFYYRAQGRRVTLGVSARF